MIGNAGTRFYDIEPVGAKARIRHLMYLLRARAGISSGSGRRRVTDFLSEVGREDLLSLFPPESRSLATQSQGAIRILDALASEQGKTTWVEKSPDHLAYIDEIARYVRPTRFIHILRNGPDNIASIYDAAQKYPDTHWNFYWGTLDRCVNQWKHSIRLTQKYRGHPNHLTVIYEELVNDPQTTLTRICEFMGLEYEETMVDNYRDTAKGIVLEKSAWKSGVFGSIRTDTSKFDIFTDVQKDYILSQLNELSSDVALSPLCVVNKHG